MSQEPVEPPKEPETASASTEAAAAPARQRKYFFTPVMADITAGISSLLAGGVTGWRLVKELAHRNTSAINFIEDIKEDRRLQGPDIKDRLEKGLITREQGYEELQKAIKWNAAKVDERMAQGGAASIWKKFGLLRPHQKWEVVISTVAVGGIALGSMLLLTRNLFTDEEKEILAKKGKDDPVPTENPDLGR